MRTVQCCVLLLYAACVYAASEERLWHSTTPPPPPSTSLSSESSDTPTTTPSTAATTPTPPVDSTIAPTPAVESTTSSPLLEDLEEFLIPIDLSEVETVEPESPKEEFEKEELETKEALEKLLTEEEDNTSIVETESAEKVKEPKKPRKWMSVPTDWNSRERYSSEATSEGIQVEVSSGEASTEDAASIPSEMADEEVDGLLSEPSENVEEDVQPKDESEMSMAELALSLPKNISELLEAAEQGIPMVQETIISKKTTVYVTITETLGDSEPLYVNLTGIRDFTGRERRVVGGCLDLSDLGLTGEEAKEVIQRMAKHKFHKLDLGNNKIKEFPSNTFSPVTFSLRELRLDGNPLKSGGLGEDSMLHRGGLFHLAELRELNLSRCGLDDMDFFTPWNSNHLEVVDLSDNNLHVVPSNLQFFHKLKKLYLDFNPIMTVKELPFALLWNLHVLSMDGCQVTAITSDPFRNMEHLKELSLADNNLTRISDVRVPRTASGVKLFLSGNPWHCSCDILSFIDHYHYAIRDIEYIRCSSPRWLEGLRTAYLTKEILSLDSVDGDCTPSRHELMAPIPSVMTVTPSYSQIRADHLEALALIVFVLAAVLMIVHVLCVKKKDKLRFEDEHDDIKYIRIEKKPNFK